MTVTSNSSHFATHQAQQSELTTAMNAHIEQDVSVHLSKNQPLSKSGFRTKNGNVALNFWHECCDN